MNVAFARAVVTSVLVAGVVWGCATDPAGTRHPRWPHAVASGTGTWRPDEGYTWVKPGDNDDLSVRWTPNTRHPRFPHVVSADAEGRWAPEDGYAWSSPGDARNLSVVWTPGALAENVHQRAAEEEGGWYPGWGYEWTDVNNRCWGCVKRQAIGARHYEFPHVVLRGFNSDGHALYEPEDGWAWVTPGTIGPTRPVAAGTPSRVHANLVANGSGAWRPADGYTWVNPTDAGDVRVKPVPVAPPPAPPRQAASPPPSEPPRTEPSRLGERAAQVIAAIQAVLREPIFRDQRPAAGGRAVPRQLIENNSQTFFRALGEELARKGLPTWNKDFPLWDLGRLTADQIVERIASGAGRSWERVATWQDAQRRANEGAVVIGGLRADPSNDRPHGHLVAVAPDLRSVESSDGAGPFVRDGNERLYEPAATEHQRAGRIWRALDVWQWYVKVP